MNVHAHWGCCLYDVPLSESPLILWALHQWVVGGIILSKVMGKSLPQKFCKGVSVDVSTNPLLLISFSYVGA